MASKWDYLDEPDPKPRVHCRWPEHIGATQLRELPMEDRVVEMRTCCDCWGPFPIRAGGSWGQINFVQCAPCTAKQLEDEARMGKRKPIRVGCWSICEVTGRMVYEPKPYDAEAVEKSWAAFVEVRESERARRQYKHGAKSEDAA